MSRGNLGVQKQAHFVLRSKLGVQKQDQFYEHPIHPLARDPPVSEFWAVCVLGKESG